jgi:hypothetical protein
MPQHLVKSQLAKEHLAKMLCRWLLQGTLNEGEGVVRVTSSLIQLVLLKSKQCLQYKKQLM